MKTIKYKVVRFIANLLDVPIVAPLLHTINISYNHYLSGDLDLSGANLDSKLDINVEGTNITSISFPKDRITEKTTINLKRVKPEDGSLKDIDISKNTVLKEL